MKRTLSIIVLALFLVTMLPIGASATERDAYEREQLLAKACEVFPEYEDYIYGRIAPQSSSRGVREVTFSETRKISETESITYVQYSDGRGIVSQENLQQDFALTSTDSSETSFAGGVLVTLSYKVTPTDTGYFSGVFYLDDFKCKVMPSTYDSILNIGTSSSNSSLKCLFNNSTPNYTESAGKSANVTYNLTFIPDRSYGVTSSNDIYASLSLSVRNDTVYVTLN